MTEGLPQQALRTFEFDGRCVRIKLELLGFVCICFFVAGILIGWLAS